MELSERGEHEVTVEKEGPTFHKKMLCRARRVVPRSFTEMRTCRLAFGYGALCVGDEPMTIDLTPKMR